MGLYPIYHFVVRLQEQLRQRIWEGLVGFDDATSARAVVPNEPTLDPSIDLAASDYYIRCDSYMAKIVCFISFHLNSESIMEDHFKDSVDSESTLMAHRTIRH